MSKLNSRIILILAFFAVASIIGWTQLSVDIDSEGAELHNIEIINPPRPLVDFQLLDQHKQDFNKDRLLGKWSFIFFGYTHCPDICPTTLTEMNALAKKLSIESNVQYIFVSVDPARDTPEYLADYVHYFNKQFIGVTGEDQNINQLAKQLGITYSRGDGSKHEYTVHHSSAILLIDPLGNYTTRFKAPHYAEVLASYFQTLKPTRDDTL